MVARSQTVEDGMARQPPFTTLHNEGTDREFIRVELVVRRPWSLLDLDRKLVVRASQVTGVVNRFAGEVEDRMKKLLIALLLASSPAFAQEAQREFVTFVDFYRGELQRTGFKPDHTSTRDSRVLFLQQVLQRYCHPHWVMKRGDPGRPLSDEAVAWIAPGAEYRKFGDFIISGGSSGWSLGSHLDGFLPVDQPLVSPLMPLPRAASTPGHLAEPLPPGSSYTVPGCQPQTPAPTPSPQPPAPLYPGYPQNEGILDATGSALFADFAAADQAPNPQMFRFAFRVAYDWLVANVPSLEASKAKHQKEWRALLGLPPQ